MPKKTSLKQMKYDNSNIERYYLKLHKINDADIIKAIDPNNKQGSIKALIRKGLHE